jgi:hypothetical protein
VSLAMYFIGIAFGQERYGPCPFAANEGVVLAQFQIGLGVGGILFEAIDKGLQVGETLLGRGDFLGAYLDGKKGRLRLLGHWWRPCPIPLRRHSCPLPTHRRSGP